jgi:Lon protease-like protein
MQQGLLPLFPLPVVLFPRTSLPLHIFEDRYKEMIGEAVRDHSEFGVVLAREKGILNMGCTATVERVLKRYPDGRLDIVTVGRRRFEVVLLNEEKTYLRGAVQFFDDDEPGAAAPAEMKDRALDAFKTLRELEPETADPELSDPQVSFQLAQIIEDVDFRQRLLRLRSEADRLKEMLEFCESYIPKQRLIVNLRRVQPHNGHGRLPLP